MTATRTKRNKNEELDIKESNSTYKKASHLVKRQVHWLTTSTCTIKAEY